MYPILIRRIVDQILLMFFGFFFSFLRNFQRSGGLKAFKSFWREEGSIAFRNLPARRLAPMYTPRDYSEISIAFGTVYSSIQYCKDAKIPWLLRRNLGSRIAFILLMWRKLKNNKTSKCFTFFSLFKMTIWTKAYKQWLSPLCNISQYFLYMSVHTYVSLYYT